MTNQFLDRNGALTLLAKILTDFIPNISREESHTIFTPSNVTDDECIILLEQCLASYRCSSSTTWLQMPPTIEISVTTNGGRNADSKHFQTPRNPTATQTQSVERPRRLERNANPHPSVPATQSTSRTDATSRNGQNTAPKRQATATSSNHERPQKRRSQVRSPDTLLITQWTAEIENDVLKVAETLREISSSGDSVKMLPDVASVVTKGSGQDSLFTSYVREGNLNSLIEAMIHCQDAVVQSEATAANIRIRAAIWKLMYADWYGLVERYA